jgi:hypothetical protein
MIGQLFRLTYSDGEDAGEFQTVGTGWQVGDTFTTVDGRHLRIVRVVPIERMSEFLDEPEYGIWEVEPV